MVTSILREILEYVLQYEDVKLCVATKVRYKADDHGPSTVLCKLCCGCVWFKSLIRIKSSFLELEVSMGGGKCGSMLDTVLQAEIKVVNQ